MQSEKGLKTQGGGRLLKVMQLTSGRSIWTNLAGSPWSVLPDAVLPCNAGADRPVLCWQECNFEPGGKASEFTAEVLRLLPSA